MFLLRDLSKRIFQYDHIFFLVDRRNDKAIINSHT